HADNYNQTYRPRQAMPDPSLAKVEAMPMTNPFWDIGGLTHPEEPWATDQATCEGIQNFWVKRGAKEELQQMAYNVRQLMKCSLGYQSCIERIKTDWEVEGFYQSKAKQLYLGLVKSFSCLWMFWDYDLESLLIETSTDIELDPVLMTKWKQMKWDRCIELARWVNMPNLIAEVGGGEDLEQLQLDEDLVAGDE
ncbi:hypothetical protein DFH28DRAFT_906155, partial [Melampsora americana]